MNSWCDKLSQVSAWYPQGLLTTTGLAYWVLKTEALFLSLRSTQRAPHTELALLTGLSFYVDSASLPPAVQARGLGASSTPTSAALIPHIQSQSKSYTSCLLRALESFHVCHCHRPHSGPHRLLPGLQQ